MRKERSKLVRHTCEGKKVLWI